VRADEKLTVFVELEAAIRVTSRQAHSTSHPAEDHASAHMI